MSKKLFSLLLAIVMVALAIPAAVLPAFATEEAGNAALTPSVNTGFNMLENFVLQGRDSWATTSPTVDDITNSGAWQAGLYEVTFDTEAIKVAGAALEDYVTIKTTGFMPFNRIGGASSASEVFMERGDWAGSYQSRALYLAKDSNVVGGWKIYLTAGADYGYTVAAEGGAQNTRPFERLPAAPAICYTAQYSGTVTVTLDGGWYSAQAQGFQHLFVRHNGVVVDDIVNDYTDVLKTYTRTVNKGDTLEFVCVQDPILSKEYSVYNDAAAAKWANMTNILGLRRAFRIDDIDIEYTSFTNVNKWDPQTALSTDKLPTDSELVRFFQWYKDGSAAPLAIGTTLDDTCVAKINPALITAGIISADDTFDVAYEKFCAYLKEKNLIVVNDSAWSYGNVTNSGTYTPFKYYAHYHDSNLLLVRSDSKVYGSNTNGYFAPAANWDTMMTTIKTQFLNAKIAVDTSGETDVVLDTSNSASVKVGALQVAYSSTAVSLSRYTNLTNGTTALGYLSGKVYAGYGGSDQAGFRYTAPSAGKLTITMDSMTAATGSYKWKVMINGAFQQSDWQTTAFEGVATMDVQAGDVVTIVMDRNGTSEFTPAFTATLVGAPHISTSTSLMLNDAYDVKMTATPSAEGGVITAYIDGEWVEGELVNGAYSFIVKDGIKVSDLTATTYSTAAWENRNPDGVTVSYQLKEVVNGHTVISAVYSTTTNKMLQAYESGDYGATVATLAKDIRHLAVVANACLYNPDGSKGDFSSTEKNYIRGKSDTALTELKAAGATNSFTGTAGKYAIAGANVNLDNRLSVVILMSANEGGSLEDLRNGGYYVEAVNGEKVVTANNIKGVTVNGTQYMGVIVNVPISMWDQAFAYTVKDAEGNAVSRTLNYSVKDWCINNYPGSASYSMQGYVVRAMYNLGVSAAAYKASL